MDGLFRRDPPPKLAGQPQVHQVHSINKLSSAESLKALPFPSTATHNHRDHAQEYRAQMAAGVI